MHLNRKEAKNDDEEHDRLHQLRRRKGGIRSLCECAFLSLCQQWEGERPREPQREEFL